MKKEDLINLTNQLYHLTLLFPKKEPLRYKMREVADEILARCARSYIEQNPVLEEFEVLDSFFEVAKNQNWVKLQDLLEIQKEYIKIRDELKELTEKSKKIIQLPPAKTEIRSYLTKSVISERKQKILDILKEKGRLQVWEVKKIFPEVTKRTLRRDFESLLKQGLIERIGERNNTFYQLKK